MPTLSPSPRCRSLVISACAAAIAVASLLFRSPAAADDVRNLYEITGVEVDETADNAETARQNAIATGERRAFETLLQRITTPEDQAKLASTPQTVIQGLIKDFWISKEKASRVRYIAELNFNFQPSQVRGFLRNSGTPFTTQPAPPAVIIPVFMQNQQPLLWEEANPWRAAWVDQTGTSLRPLRMLTPSEQSLISAEQAIAGDTSALMTAAQAAGGNEAIVATATLPPPPQPDQPLELDLTLSRYERNGERVVTPVTLRGRTGEDAASLLKRGVKEAELVLDAAWKGQTRTTPKPTAVAATDVYVDFLDAWLAVRKKLGGIDAVDAVNVVLFSRDRVHINLVYSSTPEDLVNAMRLNGLALTPGAELWTVYVGEAGLPPPNAAELTATEANAPRAATVPGVP